MLGTQEHIDLLEQFEKALKIAPVRSGRLDKEDRSLWMSGQIYQDGEVNALYQLFIHGYAYGKCWQRMKE